MHATQTIQTRFLSAERVADMIAAKGLTACLSGILEYIAADFGRWGDFDKSARVANHSATGVIELMPIADDALYAFKYVNGHPLNHRLGLSTVMAFGVLAEVATGSPLLVSELTLTTALRTLRAGGLVVIRELAGGDGVVDPRCDRMLEPAAEGLRERALKHDTNREAAAS